MLMIILYHYCIHGNIDTSGAPLFNQAIYLFCLGLGQLGVVVFVLISGYFSCKTKFNLKRLVLLLAEVIFYSLCWFAIACLVGEEVFSFKLLVSNIFVIATQKYWFFSCYIGLLIISPLLNILIKNLSRNQHLAVCIIGGIIYSFISCFVDQYLYWSELIYFMYLYILAAYIRLYNGKHSVKFDIIMCLLGLFFAYGIHIFNRYVDVVSRPFRPFILQSTTNLIIGISLLNICKKCKPHYSKFINYAAKSTFGVYLIHDTLYSRILWVNTFKNATYFLESPLVFSAHIAVTVLIVYIGATLIDILRRESLERGVSKIYDYGYKKISNSKLAKRIKNHFQKAEE